MDFLTGTVCQITPGTIPWGPGWYLIAANTRVEAGPFLTEESALYAAHWLDEACMGVHPTWEPEEPEDGSEPAPVPPYQPRYSAAGLLIGSRVRDRKKNQELGSLQDAG